MKLLSLSDVVWIERVKSCARGLSEYSACHAWLVRRDEEGGVAMICLKQIMFMQFRLDITNKFDVERCSVGFLSSKNNNKDIYVSWP